MRQRGYQKHLAFEGPKQAVFAHMFTLGRMNMFCPHHCPTSVGRVNGPNSGPGQPEKASHSKSVVSRFDPPKNLQRATSQ
jgi:hypothetical protein